MDQKGLTMYFNIYIIIWSYLKYTIILNVKHWTFGEKKRMWKLYPRGVTNGSLAEKSYLLL